MYIYIYTLVWVLYIHLYIYWVSTLHNLRIPLHNPLPILTLHKVAKPRSRFKRCAAAVKPKSLPGDELGWVQCHSEPSHDDSSASHENDSIFSADTMEDSHVSQGEPNCGKTVGGFEDGDDVGLELTLGLFQPPPPSA